MFLGSWTIHQAVLPFVTAEDGPLTAALRRRIFTIGNVVVCSVLVAGAWLTADLWVEITYGDAFAELAFLVGPYALGTACIAVVAGTAMLSSVAGNARPAMVLLAGVVVLGVALSSSVNSLESFVGARTVVVGLLVLTTWGVATVGNGATQRHGGRRRLTNGG